ncbi:MULTISPECIES: cupin domain-containing protein [Methanosarcina]|uniref:Mannose-6-phosphate isomerase n=4 Tax=Methanosarcina barkeri TaxID=2208 RepID=A0A0E3QRQ0_METBA|nr:MULTISPECIES: cupin domain-containing protein [Methanosarcina]AKB53200.1 Mannose-6-phosphate isomerase [Methanosarcina barkeri MS]AKB58695.1 Mannose-6-phosphate isomerase [Methanosarcina barkeri 227]AKJ39505.1 cupin domain-containing protein [Methanosarcina barkeri CM1]
MSLKKTLGILLAVCFLLSIAATAVSAKELPSMAGKKTCEAEVCKKVDKPKNKMKGFSIDIEKATLENNYFRKVLYTSKYSQLVIMSLNPGEDIGMEVHEKNDQFLRFEEGQGKCIINGNEYEVGNGSAVVVPAGAQHNVINTLKTGSLKFYVIYSPPVHKDGIIRATKVEAEANPEEYDGVPTEYTKEIIS